MQRRDHTSVKSRPSKLQLGKYVQTSNCIYNNENNNNNRNDNNNNAVTNTHTGVGKLTRTLFQDTDGDGSPLAIHTRRKGSPVLAMQGEGPGWMLMSGSDWISKTAVDVTEPASFTAVHMQVPSSSPRTWLNLPGQDPRVSMCWVEVPRAVYVEGKVWGLKYLYVFLFCFVSFYFFFLFLLLLLTMTHSFLPSFFSDCYISLFFPVFHSFFVYLSICSSIHFYSPGQFEVLGNDCVTLVPISRFM